MKVCWWVFFFVGCHWGLAVSLLVPWHHLVLLKPCRCGLQWRAQKKGGPGESLPAISWEDVSFPFICGLWHGWLILVPWESECCFVVLSWSFTLEALRVISGEEGGETGAWQPSAAVPCNYLVPTFFWLLCIFVFLLYMGFISNRSPALPLFTLRWKAKKLASIRENSNYFRDELSRIGFKVHKLCSSRIRRGSFEDST